jgi:hypothetical protein
MRSGNPNPVQARLTRRRRRTPGNLAQLMAVVWSVLEDVEMVLEGLDGGTPDEICKCAHAVAQVANTYAKLIALAEYEPPFRRLRTGSTRITKCSATGASSA